MKKNKIHVISAAAYIMITHNPDGTAILTSSDARGLPFLGQTERRLMDGIRAEQIFAETIKGF